MKIEQAQNGKITDITKESYRLIKLRDLYGGNLSEKEYGDIAYERSNNKIKEYLLTN